jgi:cephalosporin-C deacetylase
LAEMRSGPPKPEWRRASFQVPFASAFDLFFTGVGNARIHAKVLRPLTGQGTGKAVVMFHGYAGNSGDWTMMLGYAAAGMVVAALDCRGQGGLSEDSGGVKGTTWRGHIVRGLDDAPEQLLYRRIFLDAAQLTELIMGLPEVDPGKVGVTGWSQGGALTVATAGLLPQVSLAAPVYPFLSDYRRVWELDLGDDAYRELRDFFRLHDPLHEREDEMFRRLGYIDVQFMAPKIRAKTLFTFTMQDKCCPPSSQMAVYNRLTCAKELVVYQDHGHEHLPGVHDRILEFMLKG